MYRSEVHYDRIARAVATARCPVLANGNVTSASRAAEIVRETGAAGVMIGRHAIRNPWIFRQCRERFAGLPETRVTLGDVRAYVGHLYAATRQEGVPERSHVNKMKKYLNFVGQGVDPDGAFLHDMRRTESEAALFQVCDRHLLGHSGEPFAAEPYPGVIARPNCETPAEADGCSLETVTA
jgi:tRNA-dihydrouridine synthase